ncbi:MAG: hypothetical protein FJ293_07995 [Planctomycetes bacterium]|nr:hypothetical protein [Planctomycetota bacterium]
MPTKKIVDQGGVWEELTIECALQLRGVWYDGTVEFVLSDQGDGPPNRFGLVTRTLLPARRVVGPAGATGYGLEPFQPKLGGKVGSRPKVTFGRPRASDGKVPMSVSEFTITPYSTIASGTTTQVRFWTYGYPPPEPPSPAPAVRKTAGSRARRSTSRRSA